MRLFITGGTGFIGSHFINVALSAGHEAIALRRSSQSRPRISLIAEPIWLQKTMANTMQADLVGCDALVHFAAYGVTEGMNDWTRCFQINVTESLHLWRRAADAGVKRIVICGSCFEYGKSGEMYDYIPVDALLVPTGAYHASKAAASMAALALGYERKLELVILRPFHVFGEGEEKYRFWPSLRRAAKGGFDFPMTKGEQVRDFIQVEDVAKEFIYACEMQLNIGMPQIKNLGSGHPQTLREFAQSWWKKWEASGKLVFGAIPYRPGEIMRYVPKLVQITN